MSRLLLLSYYPTMAGLVLLNARAEARFGVSRGTRVVEALLACAIVAPLTLPLLVDIIIACDLWH
jgi:hypothetical protein